MPLVRTSTTIISDDEIEQISRLAKRLGCKEDEVEQRLLDLALDGLEDEETSAKLDAAPVDPEALPRLSEILEVAPALPEPLLENITIELPLLPGMQPGVPRYMYRRIDNLPARMDPAKPAMRYLVSRQYLKAQEEQAERDARAAAQAAGGHPSKRKRALLGSDTHHPDGSRKRHPDEKLGEKVVWSLWGHPWHRDPDLTVAQQDYAVALLVSSNRKKWKAWKQKFEADVFASSRGWGTR